MDGYAKIRKLEKRLCGKERNQAGITSLKMQVVALLKHDKWARTAMLRHVDRNILSADGRVVWPTPANGAIQAEQVAARLTEYVRREYGAEISFAVVASFGASIEVL
jgi:hypothetical protein